MTQMRDTERLLRERIADLQEQLEALRVAAEAVARTPYGQIQQRDFYRLRVVLDSNPAKKRPCRPESQSTHCRYCGAAPMYQRDDCPAREPKEGA